MKIVKATSMSSNAMAIPATPRTTKATSTQCHIGTDGPAFVGSRQETETPRVTNVAWASARERSLTHMAPRLGLTMRKPVVAVIGIVVATIAVGAVVGMVRGAAPNFSTVVTQEVVGAMTLVAVFGAVIGFVTVAWGNHVRRLIPLSVGLVLAAGWLFSYVAERAS